MKKLFVFLSFISLSILFIFSCKKEKNDVPSGDYGSSSGLRTTVTGIVLDESNAPLNGVTVSAYGQTTTTNQYGTFVFKNLNVNKDRCVLKFFKAGFFNRWHGFIASANTVNYVRVVLVSNAATQNVSAAAGGTVNLADGSSVQFQPNSFVTSNGSAYSGMVNIAIKHLSPGDANFGFMIPGNDLLGKNVNNEDVALYTYGMLGVELTGSSGEVLQLANGKMATLTLAIAVSQLSSAPSTIPLWYFDENTSLWKEEGAANKVGNNYGGNVKHFSWWNCDYQGPRSYIKGRVVDCNGNPVPNIVVTVNGWYRMLTDQNGEYYDAVPCGITFTIQVLASNNGGIFLNSQLENINSLSNNQIYTVPDFIIPCPSKVIGNIKTCTGEITDGFVSISNSSYYIYQYTINGSFHLPAPENAQMVLHVTNMNCEHSQNITTFPVQNDLNVGNIMLCDSINLVSNYFILNGGPFSNQIFNLNIFGGANVSSGTTYLNSSATSFPNYTIDSYQIYIYDTIPGSYSNGHVVIEMTDLTDTFNIQTSINPYPIINLLQVDTLGGQVRGNYNGNIGIQVNGGLVNSGTISGSFDVNRTQ